MPMMKRVVLSLFLFLCAMFVIHDEAAMAQTEDGFYVGGSRPTYFSIDDVFMRRTDLLKAIQKTTYAKIYFVHKGKMASLEEILEHGKLEKAVYPVATRKLESVYTRASDGSRLVIGSGGADSGVPQIEFIR